MRATLLAAVCLALSAAVTALPAMAQLSPRDIAETGPRDEGVGQAIYWERVDQEIIYLRPSADFKPDQDIRVEVPEPPKDREEARSDFRLSTGVLFGIILIVVIVLILYFGNNIQVSFGSKRDRRRGAPDDDPEKTASLLDGIEQDRLLAHFAAMRDRREALILMTGHALLCAASMNGMTLARAQTGRDVLRILPRGWTHMNAIRQLVREAEIVHFGGRDLAEDTWRACLELARPLFAGKSLA